MFQSALPVVSERNEKGLAQAWAPVFLGPYGISGREMEVGLGSQAAGESEGVTSGRKAVQGVGQG